MIFSFFQGPSLARAGFFLGITGGWLGFLLSFSWLRWGDILIDVGREMDVPVRLLAGEVLYRDVFYLYGPFSPYFTAFLYRSFGTGLMPLYVSGLIAACLTGWLIYRLSRFFLLPAAALFTVMVFFGVLAFGQYVYIGNYNFMLPYSMAAVHAMLFALAALYFLFRSFKPGRVPWRWLAGIFVALAWSARLEVGVMLSASILVMRVLAFALQEADPRSFFRPLFFFPLAAVALIYGLFLVPAWEQVVTSNLADLWQSNIRGTGIFTQVLSGRAAAGENFRRIAFSGLCYALLTVWFAAAGYAFARLRLAGRLIVVMAAAAGAVFFLRHSFNFELQYLCVPWVCMAMALLALFAGLRRERGTLSLALFTLSLFSLLLLWRVLLQVHAWHYGFYLLVPGLVVHHIFFLRVLPGFFRQGPIALAVALGSALVMAVFMGDHLAVSRAHYAARTLRIDSPRGAMGTFANAREEGCWRIIRFLRENTPENSTLTVFPEGATINFLSGRKNPLYYYSFLPVDLVRREVEDRVLRDLDLRRPDHVVVLDRDVTEYGSRGFGVDYARRIVEYINAHYAPVASYGPQGSSQDRFSAVVLRRQL